MLQASTLPPAKKSCNKMTFQLLLERHGNKDLDVLGDKGESKRETFPSNIVFCYEHTVSMLVLVYKENQPFADVLQNGCS